MNRAHAKLDTECPQATRVPDRELVIVAGRVLLQVVFEAVILE